MACWPGGTHVPGAGGRSGKHAAMTSARAGCSAGGMSGRGAARVRRWRLRAGHAAAHCDQLVLGQLGSRLMGRRLDIPQARRERRGGGRTGAGGLRWGHDERHCGAQRLDGRNSRWRLPALDDRTDQLRDRGRQRPGGHRRCALARRSPRRPAGRPVIDGLPAAGRHLPRRDAARRAGDLPRRRLRVPAEGAEQRPRCQSRGDGRRRGRAGSEHGDHHRHPARRQPCPGRGQHHEPDHRDRHQHRQPHDRPDRPGDLLVAGEPPSSTRSRRPCPDARAGGQSGAHTVTTTIGFREAVFTEDGFYLNGDRYDRFRAEPAPDVPLPRDGGPSEVWQRGTPGSEGRAQLATWSAARTTRSRRTSWTRATELGIMVWEEPPGWGHMGDALFQSRVLGDVRDMVVRDRNRPSVVVWGTRLNETGNYPALYAQARQIARACDGSRQTAGAVVSHTTAGWAEDVFSYDDYHVVDGEPELLPPVPGVPYLIQRISRRAELHLPVVRPAVRAGQPGRSSMPWPTTRPVPTSGTPGCWPGRASTTTRPAGNRKCSRHAAHPRGHRHLPGAQARRGHLRVAG